MFSELIVYACPVGELADQLDLYFEKSLAMCGANAAHRYMPHCTLTGFFRDDAIAIPVYLSALERALQQTLETHPQPLITITQLTFRSDWHGLELQSDWLHQLMAHFAPLAYSPTRPDQLRLKDWLHLSLAYEFPAEHHDPLAELAQNIVNLQAAVNWELRLYQHHSNGWTCHQSWLLSS